MSRFLTYQQFYDEHQLPIKIDINKEIDEIKKLLKDNNDTLSLKDLSNKKETPVISEETREKIKEIEEVIKDKIQKVMFKYIERNDYTGATRFVNNSFGSFYSPLRKTLLNSIKISKQQRND